MIIVDKNNFAIQTINKASGSATAPKSTFYTDIKVCLALEGEATWEIEDKTYHIEPGDIIFLNIGQKRFFTDFGKDGFKLCTFVLSRNAFSGIHHFMFLLNRVKTQTNVMKNSPLSALLLEAYEQWHTDNPFRYELASAKLTEFFIKAELESGAPFEPVMPEDLEMLQIMNYIDEHICQHINLASAAKQAGMSESTFSRRFSRWNGISFKQYITEKKIQHAITLLQSTNRTMLDIALESGFNSVSGFYDAFQKITGTSPRKLSEYHV